MDAGGVEVDVLMDVRVLSVQNERSGIAQYILGLFQGYREYAGSVRLVPMSFTKAGLEDLSNEPAIIPARRPFPWLSFMVPWALRKRSDGVFHGPAFAVPPRLSMPKVATIHDLTFCRLPETVDEATVRYLARVVPEALRTSAAIVVPSSEVAQDLVEYYPHLVQKDRIHVIHEGADRLPRVGGAPPLDVPYLLHLGTVEPRKNLPGLLSAWDAVRHEHHLPHQLVLVGNRGWKTEAFLKRVGDRTDIRVTGYLPDEELARFLAHADLVVTSSRYEGFGLPIVEALHQGSRVVSTPTGVARDIRHPRLHVTAGFSEEDLAEGIVEGFQLPREDGDGMPALFAWQDTWKAHHDVYREVMS